jgi:hypothetical protein
MMHKRFRPLYKPFCIDINQQIPKWKLKFQYLVFGFTFDA